MALPAATVLWVGAELSRGRTHRQIAAKLGIGVGTVSSVRNRLQADGHSFGAKADVAPVQTHLLLPDAHFPETHWPTVYAVLNFIERRKVDGITWTGDQLDMAEISHWNKENPGLKSRGAVRANLDGFARLLDEFDTRLKPGTLKRWHRGNHERFVQDLYDASPELEGMMDLEEHLKLEGRGYEVFKLGQKSRLGKLGVIHGDQVGSGKYIANKLVETHCANTVMGHVHTPSSFTKVTASGDSELAERWMGWTLPTMGTTNPAFARNRASAHLNGFGIVELFPTGQFQLYTVITDSITGAFAYGGEVFCGKRPANGTNTKGAK